MNTPNWTYFKVALLQCLALGTLVLLVACNNSNSNGGGSVIASTPQSCNIPGMTNCNPNNYLGNGMSGWSVYPQNSIQNGSNGFCGCPNGSTPVYSESFGLGCAPTNTFSTWNNFNRYNVSAFQVYSWQNFQSRHLPPVLNYQAHNIPQHYYTGSQNGTCFNRAYVVCNPNSSRSCGGNARCMRVGPASAVGACVTNNFLNSAFGGFGHSNGRGFFPEYIGQVR